MRRDYDGDVKAGPVQGAQQAVLQRRIHECRARVDSSPAPDFVPICRPALRRSTSTLRPRPSLRRSPPAAPTTAPTTRTPPARTLPSGLMVNATPANAPAHNGRRWYASHTAARCGASISRSAASGITEEGKSKIRKKPSRPAAHKPSRRPHKSRAKPYAIQQQSRA